jgi:hypothetical protein
MNTSETLSLTEIKLAIQNQIKAEEQYGAEGEILETIKTVLGDLEHILSGGYIVNGVRF